MIEKTLPADIESLTNRITALEAQVKRLEKKVPEDRVSIVVFSGDLDRVLAAFIIAVGAATMGQRVSMFFTFWGLNVIREKKRLKGKGFLQKMMTLMSPKDSRGLPVSRMNFFGAGARMLRRMMREKKVATLEGLMETARQMGVRIVACEMSRDVLEIGMDELTQAEPGGVAAFLADALKSRITLFI